jgi:cytochrome c oxidase subunit 1
MSTATATRPGQSTPGQSTPGHSTPAVVRRGNVVVKWITSTDHKTIGYMYLITSFIYFCVGGVMALI